MRDQLALACSVHAKSTGPNSEYLMDEADSSPDSRTPVLKASTVKQLLILNPFAHILIVIGESEKRAPVRDGEILPSSRLLRLRDAEELEAAFKLSEDDFSSKYGINKPPSFCVLVVIDEGQNQNQLQRAILHLKC